MTPEKLPRVTSFGVVKRQHNWHLVAFLTHDGKIIGQKVLEACPSKEAAHAAFELWGVLTLMQHEQVFP